MSAISFSLNGAPARAVFDALLDAMVENSASDLHLSADRPPSWRVHGEISTLSEEIWSPERMRELLTSLLAAGQHADLVQKGSVDLGHSSGCGERFRINVFRSLGQTALVARHLPSRFASFAELRLPKSLRDLAYLPAGMVLVTGVTGSGKSTTLATIINEINSNNQAHILTIEDPVEFVHTPKKAIISHRELHTDVPDFASAVKSSLREDPDVILVGELRDTETMRAALTAAETGHLVFSTLHTADATGAIERFVGAFPGQEQSVARHRLSLVLKAVVAQQLLPAAEQAGRVAAVEVLQVSSAVANLIASGRTAQIYSAIESGRESGMQTFDHSLSSLARERLISVEEGRRRARDAQNFDRLLRTGRND
ncbi:type IV pilus twitching motility protein PilT [Rhodocyclus tenuis]|uniref:type IV pilus twitching motility protein PilT n=1 Tax=Rhodocyclus tenuis TaxID=1066 RepID=UPI001906C46F|nr:PilT/PilU family type 4a pilus ATPase [Rhodocyclus tenuis]MBK1680877.1 twitching motility protein [Rhodocyclus tenuis]